MSKFLECTKNPAPGDQKFILKLWLVKRHKSFGYWLLRNKKFMHLQFSPSLFHCRMSNLVQTKSLTEELLSRMLII